ncbi:MAG: hypothetical protein K1X64_18140 [Myxococcaceae bacterium]|nr:hypothetical protein [Myxococcaceae bacterium]
MASTHSTSATFFFITDSLRATDKTASDRTTQHDATLSGTWAFTYVSHRTRSAPGP